MRAKYGNKKTKLDGYTFDSKAEAKRYQELKLLVINKQIFELNINPVWRLIESQPGERPVDYVADFSYKDKYGALIVEDVKGVRTRDFILKRKMMLFFHGIKIQEITK